MTHVRRVSALATVALLLVAVGGCAWGNDPATGGNPTSSPSATTTTAPPSVTTSASPSGTEVASSAASTLVRQYFAVVDQVSQNADVPLNKLSTVATSTQLSAEETLLRSQRSKGLRQIGDTTVARVKTQTVNLDNSDPSAGKVPTVQVDVCWDVTKVDVVDTNGNSVVSPSRPNTSWTRYTLVNYHYSADPTRGWRIATGQDLKQKPCSAS